MKITFYGMNIATVKRLHHVFDEAFHIRGFNLDGTVDCTIVIAEQWALSSSLTDENVIIIFCGDAKDNVTAVEIKKTSYEYIEVCVH